MSALALFVCGFAYLFGWAMVFWCWLLLELVAVNLFVLIARLSCAGCLDCLRWFVLVLVLLDELA